MPRVFPEVWALRLFLKVPHFKDIDEKKIDIVCEAITKKINTPLTSSCGRLFDAAAATAGITNCNAYEGHAAMLFEQCADGDDQSNYSFTIDKGMENILEIDFRPMLREIALDVICKKEKAKISWKFHNTVAAAFADALHSIDEKAPVALSGGCMQNALLLSGLMKKLEYMGHKTYTHGKIPPNDGGLALGQAAVALHRHAKGINQ